MDTILGCREAEGRREYYVKFADASYRRCRWVTERVVLRMSEPKLARFVRDTRGAAAVEPNVQPQWLEVERVLATARCC